MKNVANKTALLTAVVLTSLAGIFIYSLYNISGSTSFSSSETWSFPEMDKAYSDTAFGGLFAYHDINDSLPHYKYEQEKKEYDLIKDEMKRQNEGIIYSGWGYGKIGFYTAPLPSGIVDELKRKKDIIEKNLKAKDSINELMLNSNNSTLNDKYQKQADSLINVNIKYKTINPGHNDIGLVYYATLKGFSKKDFNSQFFIQNNKYFIAEIITDSIKKSGGQITHYVHYKRTELPYRYNEKEGSLQKPISESFFKFLSKFNIAFTILMTLIMGYFLIGLFLQLLVNIANGRVFTAKNISNRTAMMIVMLIYCFIAITTPYIFKWLLFSGSAKVFQTNIFLSSVSENISQIVITITVVAVRTAFKKGYKLQQEQSLTI